MAMIANLVWRFLEDEDCLWGQIMKAEYVKDGSFWEVTKPIYCSPTWNAMLKVREEMRDGCCWSVENGEDINIWTDPWIPSLPNKKPEKRDNDAQNIRKVKDLIISEEHRWDETKLSQLFSHTEVNKIMEIHLPAETENNAADKLMWIHHPKGEFSSKSFLKTLNTRAPSISTSVVFPWKQYWSVKNIPPKIHLFGWRMLKNGLPVASRIKKHIDGINDDCRLCDRNVETAEHLFLYCHTSQAALFASPLSLRTGENPNLSIQDYMMQWLAERGYYARLKMGLCMFWAIWKARNAVVFNKSSFSIKNVIWKARNAVVFNKSSFSIKNVIQEALYWFNLEITDGENEDRPTESDMLEAQKDHWEPPEDDKIKINFDGAAGDKGYACGAVARDKNAKFQGFQNRYIVYCMVVEAEAYSAQVAVELGISRGFRDIILEGDSLTVINALKYKHYKPYWRIQNTITKIRNELLRFRTVEFRYIRKNVNSVAHNLAAMAVNTHNSNVWISSPPCIAHLIESECFFAG